MRKNPLTIKHLTDNEIMDRAVDLAWLNGMRNFKPEWYGERGMYDYDVMLTDVDFIKLVFKPSWRIHYQKIISKQSQEGRMSHLRAWITNNIYRIKEKYPDIHW